MFFITCFQKIGKDKGFPDMGATRIFGYKETFEKAQEALNNNCCDMFEYLYHYAVVEEIGPGIHPEVENRWFFEWNEDKHGFFEISEPKVFKGFCNIALG